MRKFLKVPYDKWKHFVVGLAMGFIFPVIFSRMFSFHAKTNIYLSLIIIIAISYGFELFSLITKKGHYEVMDAVASVIGGVLGMIIVFMIFFPAMLST